MAHGINVKNSKAMRRVGIGCLIGTVLWFDPRALFSQSVPMGPYAGPLLDSGGICSMGPGSLHDMYLAYAGVQVGDLYYGPMLWIVDITDPCPVHFERCTLPMDAATMP